jgi:transcriptional regulator with GAF, ATPase, and Fis domain
MNNAPAAGAHNEPRSRAHSHENRENSMLIAEYIFRGNPEQQYSLDQGTLSIGRSRRNQIVLPFKSISKHHGQLQASAEGYGYIDGQSKNGSYLYRAGQVVAIDANHDYRVELAHGDEIHLGRTYPSENVLLIRIFNYDHPNSIRADWDFHSLDNTAHLSAEIATDHDHLRILYDFLTRAMPIRSHQKLLREYAAAVFAGLPNASHVSHFAVESGQCGDLRFVPLFSEIAPAAGSSFEPSTALQPIPEPPNEVSLPEQSEASRSPSEAGIMVSKTLLQKAFSANIAISIRDAAQELDQSDTLQRANIRACICVPLGPPEVTQTIIQIDNRNNTIPFQTREFHFATLLSLYTSHLLASITDQERERYYLRQQLDKREFISASPAMSEVIKKAHKAAQSARSTVLITGETGTGKEVLAGLIHDLSNRRNNPFIIVNCASLPEDLLENELFGHERGAFTGANERFKGRFELADEGTLFFDEIGELSLTIQKKLLRVLQDCTFERLGGNRSLKVNLRIIAATNRDLKELVASGHFREDLYYRLNVIQIQLPPLRERKEDILPLAEHFSRQACRQEGKPFKRLSPEGAALLQDYHWPGNIRELANCLERAVILSEEAELTPADIDIEMSRPSAVPSSTAQTFQEKLQEARRRIIEEALEECHGVQREAARRLGLYESHFSREMKRSGLR